VIGVEELMEEYVGSGAEVVTGVVSVASALVATGADDSITGVVSAAEVVVSLAKTTATSELEEATEVAEREDPLGAAGAGSLSLSERIHFVFAVSAAGQATCVKETVGLSQPSNQSKRQRQPAWRASGKESQLELSEIPPYCAPHPEEGAPHSVVQPLKIPTPPPGIYEMSVYIRMVVWGKNG